MFCTQCGKQLPDDAKFCSACGARTHQSAPRTAAPTQNPVRPAAPTRPAAPAQNTTRPAAPAQSRPAAPAQNAARAAAPAQNSAAAAQKTAQSEKKKSNPLTVVLVFVVMYLVGYWLSGGFGDILPAKTIDAAPFAAPSGESFVQILPAGHSASKFNVSTESYAAYIKEDSDGTIYLMEFGYEEDLVKEIIVTAFIRSAGMSQEEMDDFLVTADDPIEQLHASHSFINGYTGTVGDYEYLYLKAHLRRMDVKENIQIAVAEDLLTVTADSEAISMYKTEQSLRQEGYAKK